MANRYIKTGKEIKCRTCKKSIYLMPYEIKSGRKKYCSKVCLYKGDSYTKTFQKGHPDFVPKDKRGHTQETRIKIGLSGIGKHVGNLAWNWIEDRTKLKDIDKDRNGQFHREWSRGVKNRDKWKCKISNTDCEGRMESHHILSWKDYPELRYQINNGITLCHAHHPKKRAEEKRLAPYFMELVTVSKETL